MTRQLVTTADGHVWELDMEQERREATEAARRYFALEKRQPEAGELSQFVHYWLEAAKVYGPRRADYSRPPDVRQLGLFS